MRFNPKRESDSRGGSVSLILGVGLSRTSHGRKGLARAFDGRHQRPKRASEKYCDFTRQYRRTVRRPRARRYIDNPDTAEEAVLTRGRFGVREWCRFIASLSPTSRWRVRAFDVPRRAIGTPHRSASPPPVRARVRDATSPAPAGAERNSGSAASKCGLGDGSVRPAPASAEAGADTGRDSRRPREVNVGRSRRAWPSPCRSGR